MAFGGGRLVSGGQMLRRGFGQSRESKLHNSAASRIKQINTFTKARTQLKCCSLRAYLGDVGGLGLSRLGQRRADRPMADQRDPSCQLSEPPKGQQTDGNGNEPAESSF